MKHFAKLVPTRPLLVVFDGHSSHVELKVIEFCLDENITLLKLPPHATDILQPADVACFNPLKNAYERELHNFNNIRAGSAKPKK